MYRIIEGKECQKRIRKSERGKERESGWVGRVSYGVMEEPPPREGEKKKREKKTEEVYYVRLLTHVV